MHQVDMAAAFIKSNMPYGAGNTLSDQEAWDVAAYVNSRPRPQDPRFADSLEKTREKFHVNHEFDYYGIGRDVPGFLVAQRTGCCSATPDRRGRVVESGEIAPRIWIWRAGQRIAPPSTITDIGFAPASARKAGELSTACTKASIDFQSEEAVENGNNSACALGSNISVIPAITSAASSLMFFGVTCLSRLSLNAVAQPSDQPP